MENKLLEFVREFNTKLEENTYDLNLNYTTNGLNEVLLLFNIYLWSDDEGSEYSKQKALSSLVRQLDSLQVVAKDLLETEIFNFFAQKKKELKEKFTLAKLTYSKRNTTEYNVSLSGNYNEDTMEQFLDVLDEDFNYMFNGFKLHIQF